MRVFILIWVKTKVQFFANATGAKEWISIKTSIKSICPQFGVISDTIEKLTKLVYVYNSVDMSYIGSYSTVQCSGSESRYQI